MMDETTTLLAQIKEDLLRKDETYALIADSKPTFYCTCSSCSRTRYLAAANTPLA